MYVSALHKTSAKV